MNRKTLTESAALRALGLLGGDELRRFESELLDNPDARSALEHFQEASRRSAFFPASCECAEPAEAQAAIEATASAFPAALRRWLPWGLAACLAVAVALLWLDRSAHADTRADAAQDAQARVAVATRAAAGGL